MNRRELLAGIGVGVTAAVVRAQTAKPITGVEGGVVGGVVGGIVGGLVDAPPPPPPPPPKVEPVETVTTVEATEPSPAVIASEAQEPEHTGSITPAAPSSEAPQPIEEAAQKD